MFNKKIGLLRKYTFPEGLIQLNRHLNHQHHLSNTGEVQVFHLFCFFQHHIDIWLTVIVSKIISIHLNFVKPCRPTYLRSSSLQLLLCYHIDIWLTVIVYKIISIHLNLWNRAANPPIIYLRSSSLQLLLGYHIDIWLIAIIYKIFSIHLELWGYILLLCYRHKILNIVPQAANNAFTVIQTRILYLKRA